jgi:hypothetical protein
LVGECCSNLGAKEKYKYSLRFGCGPPFSDLGPGRVVKKNNLIENDLTNFTEQLQVLSLIFAIKKVLINS